MIGGAFITFFVLLFITFTNMQRRMKEDLQRQELINIHLVKRIERLECRHGIEDDGYQPISITH